jgi:hypothetical protein
LAPRTNVLTTIKTKHENYPERGEGRATLSMR